VGIFAAATPKGSVKNKKNKKFLEERIEITDDNGITVYELVFDKIIEIFGNFIETTFRRR